MKKIVVACDSFKESMSAIEACQAIEKGILKTKGDFTVKLIPMADGGEGTVDAISYVTAGQFKRVSVQGPLGDLTEAKYLLLQTQQIAFIEVAEACGLNLVPTDKRNPLKTSTYGVGEMILDAIKHQVKHIYLGLGGSSTNDGGLGLLRALQAKFYDNNGNEITAVNELLNLTSIDLSKTRELLKNCQFTIMSDVDNEFIGENGATYVFGRQKGASRQQLEILEKCLITYNDVVKKQYNIDLKTIKKTGAAGGMGGAFYLLEATMKSGIETVLELTRFEEKIKDADYIVTGEGSIDFQTANGKTISGILKIARKYNIPVIAFAGKVDQDIDKLYNLGLTAAFSITNEAKSLSQALIDGYESLWQTTYNVFRLIDNEY